MAVRSTKNRTYSLTDQHVEYLSRFENASAFLRGLIDQYIEAESGVLAKQTALAEAEEVRKAKAELASAEAEGDAVKKAALDRLEAATKRAEASYEELETDAIIREQVEWVVGKVGIVFPYQGAEGVWREAEKFFETQIEVDGAVDWKKRPWWVNRGDVEHKLKTEGML